MAKKDFSGSITDLFNDSYIESPLKNDDKSQQISIARTSFNLDKKTAEKFKKIAYWERKTLTELINNILSKYIQEYEKDNPKNIL